MSFVRGAYAIGGNHSPLPLAFVKNAAFPLVGRTLWLLGLVLFVATTVACSNAKSSAAGVDAPESARQVKTVMVTQQPLTRTITVTGTLAAEEQVALSFKVAGR